MKNLMLIFITLLLASCGSGGGAASTPCGGSPKSVAAAVSVVRSDSADSSYSILGTGLDGVSGIDMTISYAVDSVSSPSVTQGSAVSGAMFLVNTNAPGIIRIAVVSTKPFKGDGSIAQITFGAVYGSGSIKLIRFQMIDAQGKTLATGSGSVPETELIANPALNPPADSTVYSSCQ